MILLKQLYTPDRKFVLPSPFVERIRDYLLGDLVVTNVILDDPVLILEDPVHYERLEVVSAGLDMAEIPINPRFDVCEHIISALLRTDNNQILNYLALETGRKEFMIIRTSPERIRPMEGRKGMLADLMLRRVGL